MVIAHGDYETRSVADLQAVGLANYAAHPTTDAWCLSYRFDKSPVRRWNMGEPLDVLHPLFDHIAKGGIFKGHNVAFEIAITNEVMHKRHGWPITLKTNQCRCTMAQGYAMSLPGALERMAPALGIKEEKDAAGKRLMLQMCRPREIVGSQIVWWDDADKKARLGLYCDQDVITESAADERLMPLSDAEQALWELDAEINLRGVNIDHQFVRNAIRLVQYEQDRLNAEMRAVTGNFVGFCTEVARLTKWVRAQGVAVDGLAKADVLDALADKDLPAHVRTALLLRQEAGKSSTSKLSAMVERASADGRLRGTLQYHGAGTGRWAGRGVQVHNLVRPKEKAAKLEKAIGIVSRMTEPRDAAQLLEFVYGPPLDIIAQSMRGAIIAGSGNTFYTADFKNIEGRGLAWLAGEEWKLQAFRDYDAGIGPDLYLVAAARIWGKRPSDFDEHSPERQHGKVAELACGYGGGVGAFQTMAKTYLVKVADDMADTIKTAWRIAHPKTVNYWYALEEAAIAAVLKPGQAYEVGPKGREVRFKVKGSFLWCRLPSGRVLTYPYPKIKAKETPWGEMRDALHYMAVDSLSNKWQEVSTYGGSLAENVTQALCRDLLVAAIWQSEAACYPVVLHVHDEVVSEVKKGFGNLADFERLCSTMPAWALDLPVVAKGWTGDRYRKE